ncbi:polyketide synthase, putative [Beauveria bassiana ARSEF 2860]|uniref:Polyketide synthase, putative n=2 Tax=Beauveria bassiana TaxID=176275 RepID=J5K0Q7_BEAB2|nr:polyketide synthase, putative [Beauveria bassiana ARSEF 2860]EJP67836.1 polyketide synthase, putative [Beauveria bassiana ARSEF 2860]
MPGVLKIHDSGSQSPLQSYAVSETSSANGNAAKDPIAICGMACRLPGGIENPEQLWTFLTNKQDGRSRVPESRYNTDGFSSTRSKPGATRTDYGYFIDDNLRGFDASRFHMSVKELERCDPQQRLLLQVSQECIDDAGEMGTSGRRIGVYVGDMQRGWSDVYEKETQNYGTYHLLGLDDFALANRVSYEMNLKGPSVTVRTACASSLSALSGACRAIATGECDGAIVGGVSIIMGPTTSIQVGEQGALSPDGSCKSFSANANGYARAEGVSTIYIKPLSAALRDGNPVRAIIRAAATSHNGRAGGITASNTAAQQELIKHAYSMAGIDDIRETAFVECHGTGTPVGDPAEAEAVGSLFGGDDGIYIGSVKANLGHSEGASGLTSIIKAVLSLEHNSIPPNIKFDVPNPAIPFAKYNITVPTDTMPWPEDRKKRVSINNFGIGGANSHVILDSAELFEAGQQLEEANDHPHLLVYSAATSESLSSMGKSYAEYLNKHPERIQDVAYTLVHKRQSLKHRGFLVASRDSPGSPSIPTPSSSGGSEMNIVMVFTGQGAQWPQMGRDLLKSNENFRNSIQRMDLELKRIGGADLNWTIEGELKKTAKRSRVNLAEFSQPLCTAVQVSLVECFKAIGVTPSAVVGHSSGEIAGAYAAGALTLEEAITAAYHRGAVAEKQNREGAMAAIGLSWNDVKPFLIPTVGVACDNSPNSVTISGDADKVAEVVQAISLAMPDVLARLLKVDKAYHSYHMAEVGPVYFDLVGEGLGSREPRVPFFSSVEGRLLNKTEFLGAKYWQKNLESPVLFNAAVSAVAETPIGQNAIFLEIGPHSALSGPVRQILAKHKAVSQSPYVAAMLRGQPCTESLLSAFGKLYTLGASLDLKRLYPTGVTLRNLPTYPWNNSRAYWHETRVMREWRERRFKHHDVLGLRTLESTDFDPVWRNLFHLDNAPWVRDHVINGDVVFPFAAYIAMAGEAIRQITGTGHGFQLRDATATTALVVPDDKPVELITTFHRVDSTSAWWQFSIASHNGGTWVRHFHGAAATLDEPLGQATVTDDLPRSVDSVEWYEMISRTEFEFGPAFRCIQDLKSSTRSPSKAQATIRNSTTDEESNYYMHPTSMDNVFQLIPVASLHGLSRKLSLNIVTSIAYLSVAPCATNFSAGAVSRTLENGTLVGECEGYWNGRKVISVSGARINVMNHRGESDSHAAARPVWAPHFDFERLRELADQKHDGSGFATEVNEITDLALLSIGRSLATSSTALQSLDVYRAWVNLQLGSGLQSTLSDDELFEKLGKMVDELGNSSVFPLADAIKTTATAIREVATKQGAGTKSLESLTVRDQISPLIGQFDLSAVLASLAHTKPNLRILEINAGSGSLTSQCLDSLHGRYSAYAFTDASRNLVNEGKMRFEGVANMDFKMLDISQSIQDSEFAEEQDRFDLIIAIDAVHRSNDPVRSLKNIRTLLRPNGRLILQELAATKDARWVDLVMGTAQSWWTATRDSAAQLQRFDEKGWTDALDNAGLEVDDVIAAEIGNPFHTNNLFIAKPKVAVKSIAKHELCVLTVDLSHDVAEMSARLKQRGYNVEQITLQDEPPANKDVIALCDEKSCFFSSMSAETFQLFNRFTSRLESSGLLWVSPLSFRRATTPDYAQVVGFGRSIRAELDIDFAVCQTETEFANDLVLDVMDYFTMRNKDGAWQASTDATPEMEFAIYNGSVHVGRYYPFSLAEEHLTAEEDDRAVLRAGRQGRPAELEWQSYPAVEPSRNKVEITVFASGLNQVDVSLALGSAKQQEQATFGLEGAGVIHRVEDGVTEFQVGDRVAFLSEDSMSTSVIVHQKLVVKIPESTTLAEAATIPYTYSSADFALVGLGGLVGGQSVLIHGAYTHLGLAALRMAQVLGAEIYVTADNSTAETHGLAEERIFDARKPSFADDLIQATRGRGVDMLLNAASLAGNTGRQVCRCVADCGSVIDMCSGSSSDFYDILNSKGASYRIADLRRLCSAKPDAAATHLRSAMGFYLHGAVKAKSPPKVFAAKDAAEAFAHMLDHPFDSKAVVEIRNELEVARRPAARPEISVVQRERYLKLDSHGSYLLVGGFGGLGRQVAIWLAENGAGNIMFLSRSAGTELSHQQLIAELVSMGAGVQALQGSVTCMQDVRQAIQQAALPVKGIIQMSMVLRDTAWGAMTFDDWVAASEPKVRGTWNLHNASLEAGASLDLFVMFSSIAAVVGMPGQTNYAAGNTFLDAFAQYRNDLGLAASTINVGVVEDMGVVARDPSLLTGFKSMDFVTVRASDVISALSLAIKKPSPKASRTYDGSRAFVDPAAFAIGLGSTTPLSSPDSRALWKRDVRMAMYRNRRDADGGGGGGQGGSRNDGLRAFLSSARSDKAVLEAPEAATLLAQEIGTKVLSMLGKPVDSLRTDLSLSDIGMDSLVGIEMRKWWKGTFGFEISLLEMLGMGTLELLGKHVIANLMKLFHER